MKIKIEVVNPLAFPLNKDSESYSIGDIIDIELTKEYACYFDIKDNNENVASWGLINSVDFKLAEKSAGPKPKQGGASLESIIGNNAKRVNLEIEYKGD